MNRLILIIILFIQSFAIAQIYTDCFKEVKDKKELELQNQKQLNEGDTVSISFNQFKEIIGCKFPYAPIETYDKKVINPSTEKSKYVIINFNYSYCDFCVGQLDYLIKLKRESKVSATIISFFKEKTKDIEWIIEKYKKDIFFVTDANKWMLTYGLYGGQPLNYVLDKNKAIQYAESGGSFNYTQFYNKIKEVIK